MSEKKVLIICPDMGKWARNFGACQRNYYLAKYLENKGYDISVITIKHSVRKHLKLDIKFRVIAKECLYKAWLVPIIGNDIIRKYLTTNISPYEHDELQVFHWVESNKDFICGYINQNKIEKVIISVPEFFLLWLAPYIRIKCHNIRIIFDYRDTWSVFRMKKDMTYFVEKFLLRFADHIIYSVPVYKKVNKLFSTNQMDFSVILNGYSEELWKGIKSCNRDRKRMVLSYVGSIQFGDKANYYRNPKQLIEAFIQENSLGDMLLQFVGVKEITSEMRAIAMRANNRIIFKESVEPEESYQFIIDSDVVIAINQAEEPGMNDTISGKLYDYLRSGRDIFYIGNKTNVFSKLIRRNNWGTTCENETQEICRAIRLIRERWLLSKQCRSEVDISSIRKYSREYQNERYCTIIDAL